ncbi:hypothetical protein [Arcticibacter svalbardensis]|uniref:hypothetical protein n=1 Tax=Arcticibacter svalbardensis TaxID=1288027 RepID=UPI00058DC4AE|nr:hypothetical protein [Arcticibacter svalbardensis]
MQANSCQQDYPAAIIQQVSSVVNGKPVLSVVNVLLLLVLFIPYTSYKLIAELSPIQAAVIPLHPQQLQPLVVVSTTVATIGTTIIGGKITSLIMSNPGG